MSANDALVEAILAAPDDDAPRLVWADREGGERGELVVVQCALARGEGDRETRRRLYARERELLAKREKGRFMRGFLVHRALSFDEVRTPADVDALFAAEPLLSGVDLVELRLESHEYAPRASFDFAVVVEHGFAHLPPGRITTVTAAPQETVDGDYPRHYEYGETFMKGLARTEAGRAIEQLELDGSCSFEALAPFRALVDIDAALTFPLSRLGDLHLTHPKLARIKPALEPAQLQGDELAQLLESPLASKLTSLDLSGRGIRDDEVIAIASAPRLGGLRHLGLRSSRMTKRGVEALAASPHLAGLRSLALPGDSFAKHIDDESLPVLANATFAPNLRALDVRNCTFTEAAVPIFASFSALDRLAIHMFYGFGAKLRALDDVIPSFSR